MDLFSQDAGAPKVHARAATIVVTLGGFVLLALASVIAAFARFDAIFILGAFLAYTPATAIIVVRITAYHPHAQFGAANVITLGRLIIASLLAGLVAEIIFGEISITPFVAWCFFVFAVIGLVFDGFDGAIARREGLVSKFGSRFDMEVDALQIMLLSIIAVALLKAGVWVLLSGLLRYIFIVASLLWPALAGDLPPSWRRKAIAVIQGGVLAALLAPIINPPISILAAGIAVFLLIYSFAADIIWLVRTPKKA